MKLVFLGQFKDGLNHIIYISHQICFARKLQNIDLQCHENNCVSPKSAAVFHVEGMTLLWKIFRLFLHQNYVAEK